MHAKINPKKVEMFNLLKEFLDGKDSVFFLDYRGLTVATLTELRNRVENEKGELKVVKNNIMKRVLKDKHMEGLDSYLLGPTAVVTAVDEANVIAKIFYEFVKTSSLKVKGGFVLGEVYDEAKLNAYSKLPTKKESISLFMNVLKAPISKLARTLKALSDVKDVKV
ncbi:50S ribosomal protein L10 [Borrelia turicatae]|uniref:Large ribosomal subunit protein uL10 n=2 Tax=Borrelia turicatae TaxID=142 RepID=RL10_BORT9|nr:50S ribosomal protein L10 [Borrelia turicatae]A1QZH9.1 RecName: Full=Large ribosomal subunit protein uL10; AltName: Full=50S ribosomal protein L10 [Borrelia turicatae 91E135]AAX17721.1 LSU ribosomal protein L10P [Borrelia turicatae 91E135]ANF33867.1 50S ribosomal protein L10 [Borrelia turicatae]UPA13236.1 50S ribosomal protein L10 [Borrelia turicatae 91E135]UPA14721.1 50S ribosomal protein L10 [Borrelia turicatae]